MLHRRTSFYLKAAVHLSLDCADALQCLAAHTEMPDCAVSCQYLGSFSGNNCPDSDFCEALLDCLVYGRIAGRTAAQNESWM